MTNPNPSAEPNASDPDAKIPAVISPVRKAPRRATAAAGSPVAKTSAAPAILVIDANGMIVPPSAEAGTTADLEASAVAPSTSGEGPLAVEADTPDVADPGLEAATSETEAEESEEAKARGVENAESTELSESVADTTETGATQEKAQGADTAEAEGAAAAALVEAPLEVAQTSPMLSRRERRLAEQQAENGASSASPAVSTDEVSGTEPAATVATATNGTAVPHNPAERGGNASTHKSKPRPKRNRFVALVRGLCFLIVISALVVSLGTVLSGPDVGADEYSHTQEQRQAAWETTTTLQIGALGLVEVTSTPQLRTILSNTAQQLGIQAAALSDGLPTETATPTPTAASLPTVTQLREELTANAESLLASALTAEGSMGRVFASVGTGQLLQARELGSATAATMSASGLLPAKVDFPVPSGPQCATILEPRPGTTIDAALSAAALGEQKAIYAYQVASTRFAEPQFSKSTALLDRHQQKLNVLNEELRLRCLPPAAPVAGYALNASFTSMPKPALSTLEAELSALYADLSAFSAANPAYATASPGAAGSPDATQQPPKGSNLRELSVLWLLDSTEAQISWGGTLDALPGIESAATAP
ncbi:DUF4439 domain-containing protein [Arthrobacter psychrochitiniphilus]|uniref:DUF4439 domain-containing protein n=1 Tax=Arthrobacter psychrochitiniphilus TaxID=291045 RepID=UPI003F7BE4CD